MHPMRHIYILSVVILCLLSMVGGCRHAADMGVACEIREVAREQLQADSSRLVKDAIAAIDTIECSDAEGARQMYTELNRLLFSLLHRGDGSKVVRLSHAMLSIVENAEHFNAVDKLERMNLYVILGTVFSDSGMPSASLDFYTRGLDACTDSADMKYKALYYNNIGVLYADANMLEKASEYFNMALEINTHLNVHHEAFLNYANLAELYALKGEVGKAQELAQKSLDHLNGDSNPILLANMRVQQGEGYERLEQYDVALLRYHSALSQYKKNNYVSGVVETYIHLSDIYQKQHMPDSSLYYASAALREARHANQAKLMVKALNQLSDVQSGCGESASAYRLLRESITLADSLHITEAALRLENWEGFNNAVAQTEEDKDHSSLWIIMLICICLITLGAAIIIPIILTRRNRELRRAGEERMVGLAGEMNQCNRELTTLSLDKIRMAEGIEGVCDELKSVLLELNPRETAKRDRIRRLLGRMEQLSSEHGDEEFRHYFERVNPDFYRILSERYPDLTQRDLRLCAFLLLGLNTKEIASMTYREVRSVESARNRLRKKLGLDNSDDLQDFFKSLYSGAAS